MGQGPTSALIFRWLVVVCSIDICQGKIKSFTVTTVSQVTSPASGCIRLTDEVALVCDTESDLSEIKIKRLQDATTVAVSRSGESSLKYVIDTVSCSDMGTYQCVMDSIDRRTVDLVIVYCPLQTCDGAAVQRSMFANFREGINFSVCVLACEKIAENAEFNDSLVRRNSSTNWTWHYEHVGSTNVSTGRIHIRVQRHPVDTEAYGLLRLRIFSVQDQQYYVTFSMTLKPPGAPDCPTGITITNYGHDYVILSWVPGSDGGFRQYFIVYLSMDNVTWPPQGGCTDNTTATVTGLNPNTSYYFRVVSGNQYRESVGGGVCTRTVFVTTKSDVKSVQEVGHHKGSDVLILTLSFCSLLVVMLLLSAFLCWRRRVNRGQVDDTSPRKEESSMSTTQNDTSSSLAYCVSDDALKYISVYPVHNQRKKRKKMRIKREKILYAKLDLVKTQQLSREAAPK